MDASLPNLPTEILLLLISHLSNADKGCLAIACHRLADKLGAVYWDRKLVEKEAHGDFLRQYARSDPAHLYCHACIKLHPYGAISPPHPSQLPRYSIVPTTHDTSLLTFGSDTPWYALSFLHVGAAVNYHTGSLHGFDVKHLTHRSVVTVTPNTASAHHAPPLKRLTHIDAAIVDGHLLLRRQHWLTFSPSAPSAALDAIKSGAAKVAPCIHHSSRYGEAPSNLPFLGESHFYTQLHGQHRMNVLMRNALVGTHDSASASKRGTVAPRSQAWRCTVCAACSLIQILPLGSEGALVSTTWTNLGRGIDPTDMEWARHLSEAMPEYSWSGWDIRPADKLFEAQAGRRSLAYVTKRNEVCLVQETFAHEPFRLLGEEVGAGETVRRWWIDPVREVEG